MEVLFRYVNCGDKENENFTEKKGSNEQIMDSNIMNQNSAVINVNKNDEHDQKINQISKVLDFPIDKSIVSKIVSKYENFEKLTPEIFKMSFFVKFKISPHLPPYYSTEPMKYVLRVIF